MKVLLWADAAGAAKSIEVLGTRRLAGLVGAVNRPADRPGLEDLARRCGVSLLVQPFRRDETQCHLFTEQLRAVQADLFLVSSYSMILPGVWLTMPALGTVNVHAALLPQYRGANVLNWVLVNGERETGVTIHHMDEGIDTGDIICQKRVAIDFEDTAVTLQGKLAVLWPSLLSDVLGLLESGACSRSRQDERCARHWPRRRPDDGRFEWAWPAERIYNLIRALVKPWPGAFCEGADGKRMTFDSFRTLEDVRQLQRRHAA
jgi:methionyl-tRNA formyltransferase